MKKKRKVLALLAMLASVSVIIGCSGKEGSSDGKVDVTTPIAQLKAAAENMDVDQLMAKATAYKNAITAKQADVDNLMEKFNAIPIADKLGEEAQALKTDLDELAGSLKDLKERMDIYVAKLKELKADISSLQL